MERYPLTFGILSGEVVNLASSLPFDAKLI